MPPAGSAYGSYAPLTLFPGLMSTADQLTNFGAVVHTPTALVATKSSGLSSRSDRLEVSTGRGVHDLPDLMSDRFAGSFNEGTANARLTTVASPIHRTT